MTNRFVATMFEFDGILLKPCLLQPCFHVAGSGGATPKDEAVNPEPQPQKF